MTGDLLTQFRSDVPLPGEATAERIYARATSRRRRVPRHAPVLAAAAVALAVPAVVLGSGLLTRTPSPRWVGQHLKHQFISDVAVAARDDPKPRYARATRAGIERTLVANEARFGYRIRRVDVLPGRDGAPLIILGVPGDLHAFARSVQTLERIVDPISGKVDPSTGERRMKYEAFFLEAVDSHGVPFLVVWNVWRQTTGADRQRFQTGGGGQWAREETLLPFGHL